MRLLVAILLFAALPALAEEELAIPGVVCNRESCVIPREILNAMIDIHNKHVEDIRALKAAGPKCAETEITEPSKNPAPKPIPYIKPERDS